VAWPKIGWPSHPIFGQGVAGATSYGRLVVVEPPPWPRGWSDHPQKPKKKKKQNKTKKQSMGFGLLGVAGPPPRAWGGFDPYCHSRPEQVPREHHLVARPVLRAGAASFFFFFLGFWGWLDHPLGHGGGSTTPRSAVGVAPATPWPKMGWPEPHPLAKPPPDFLPFFFFFFFFLGIWGWLDHPFGHGGGSTTPRPAVGVAPATPWPKMGWSEPPPDFLPPPPPLIFFIL
jgi:hypothetical protein